MPAAEVCGDAMSAQVRKMSREDGERGSCAEGAHSTRRNVKIRGASVHVNLGVGRRFAELELSDLQALSPGGPSPLTLAAL